ncbi:hypothetical protein DEO72_LG4g1134 [Vigna unguiculata]|uniref:Uncharacterized protein n=1 Tax=Vigna unguiculata TaxID=3917 RepID=A0A4D6LMZ1_VIGUN|nr:hypothetical protein DEO72_LG4g1134 [Vigna unguiculata]
MHLLPHLQATTCRTCVGNNYGPHSVTPGGVSNMNIVRNVPRLPNSSTKYQGGESFWTHLYETQLAHSHRQHSPIRATTQGFLVFIRHPKPQLKKCHSEPQLKECHMFNPYLKPQLKGYVLSHHSRNTPASRSLRYNGSLVCRPRTSKPNNHFASSLSPDVAPQPLGEPLLQTAWQKPHAVKRHLFQWPLSNKCRLVDRPHRQALRASEPHYFCSYHLAVKISSPGTTPVLALY